MVDVLLIYPPITFKKGVPETLDVTLPPLGLLYLASALEKNDISLKVMDVGAERLGIEDVLLIIEKERPSVVGISSMTANLQGAVQVAKEIKNKFGDKITIGLGGAHESADPEFVNRFSHLFDFGLVGEGEITFPKIVRRVLNREPFERINYGEIALNLDEIPFPARHLVKNNRYQKTIGIMASRGCPYACTFCSRPAVPKKIRFRSPENVVDEMEIWFDDCRGEFIFEDDTFTLKKEHTLQLCEEIINRGLKAKWTCVTRPDRVDQDLLKTMAKAGCQEILFGVESGNEYIRNTVIKKGIYDYQISNAIKWCKKYKIIATLFLMLGFPQETKGHLEDTVNYGLKVKPDGIGVHLTVPMPGSKIFQEAIEEGVIDKNVIDLFIEGKLGKGFRDIWPVYIPQGMTKEILTKARNRAHRRFYFRPSYLAKRFVRDLRSWTQLKSDFRTAISLIKYGRTKTAVS